MAKNEDFGPADCLSKTMINICKFLIIPCGAIHALFTVFAYHEQRTRTTILQSHADWLSFYHWMANIYTVIIVMLLTMYGLLMMCTTGRSRPGGQTFDPDCYLYYIVLHHGIYYGSSMLIFRACTGMVDTTENPDNAMQISAAKLYSLTQLLFVAASVVVGTGWWAAFRSLSTSKIHEN
jgi:hypothetical protein